MFDALPRKIHCKDCNIYFVNDACFNSHKKPSISKLSRCQVYYRCEHCSKILNEQRYPKDDQNCNLYMCKYCKQFELKDHLCFIQRKVKKQDNEEELDEEQDNQPRKKK